jgi:hypothetical protein
METFGCDDESLDMERLVLREKMVQHHLVNTLCCDGRRSDDCVCGSVASLLAFVGLSLDTVVGRNRRVETLVLSLPAVACLYYCLVGMWDPNMLWVRVEKSQNRCLVLSMMIRPLNTHSPSILVFVPVVQQAMHSS